MSDILTDHLEHTLRRNVLRYAVQRAIFCPVSGDILDMRRAVLFDVTADDGTAGTVVTTAAVFDKLKDAPHLQVSDVHDGRELWK